jgi:hypothetical protein
LYPVFGAMPKAAQRLRNVVLRLRSAVTNRSRSVMVSVCPGHAPRRYGGLLPMSPAGLTVIDVSGCAISKSRVYLANTEGAVGESKRIQEANRRPNSERQ